MRKLLLLIAGCLFSLQIFAGSLSDGFKDFATSGAIVGTTGTAASHTIDNTKIVAQAQDDAATFVASNGEIKGVYLENALNHLRQQHGIADDVSDLSLAKAILGH